MAIDGYHLGCPIWGRKDWVGHLYSPDARQRDYLAQYARVFNTVEGNTTFYNHLPAESSVRAWRNATPASCHFSFKLPRLITHELALEDAHAETAAFLERMSILGPRLGPFMIQLPPSFGPDRLGVLDRFLATLPGDLSFGVEVRHRGFYDNAAEASRLVEVLAGRGAERVWMDTRAMRDGDQEHPDVMAARHKKPDLPVVPPLALGSTPMLRFVGHPEDAVNEPWLEQWSVLVAGWIREGRRPYVFVHCPNDFHAPRLARRFHQLLAEKAAVGEMPEWPGEAADKGRGEQLSLL